MTVHTYDDFQKLVGIDTDDLSPEATEKLMDVAIGILNLFGADLQKLNGTEGSKTINCDGPEWAVIVQVTKLVYVDLHEEISGDVSIGDLEVKARNYLTDPDVMGGVEDLARRLQLRTSSPYDNIVLV